METTDNNKLSRFGNLGTADQMEKAINKHIQKLTEKNDREMNRQSEIIERRLERLRLQRNHENRILAKRADRKANAAVRKLKRKQAAKAYYEYRYKYDLEFQKAAKERSHKQWLKRIGESSEQ